MGFEEDMQDQDDQWDKDQKSGGQLPDGEYDRAQIVECRVEMSEKTNLWQWYLKFEADVEDGDAPWRGAIRKWTNLDGAVGSKIAAQDAKRLGYTGKASGLAQACESGQFDDLICRIKVETKPGETRDYTNVYINQVHERGAGTTAGAKAGASTMDDDIPF